MLLPLAIGGGTAAHEHRSIRAEVRDGLGSWSPPAALAGPARDVRTVYLIWGAFLVIEPIYVREVLHGSPTMLALLQTTFGVGLLLTTLLVTRLGERVARIRVAAIADGRLRGRGRALRRDRRARGSRSSGFWCGGASRRSSSCRRGPSCSASAPIETHGRVMALDGTMNNGGSLVALPLVGVAAAVIGVQAAGVSFAIVPIVGGLVTLWRVRADGDRPAERGIEAAVEPAAA